MTLIRRDQRIAIDGSYDCLYLPYSGNETEGIIRLFKGFCLLVNNGFRLDENNSEVVKVLAEIAGSKAEKKGLVIRGVVGVGKTFLIREWLKFRSMILSFQCQNGIYRDWIDVKTPEIIFLTPTKILSKFTKEGFQFFEEEPIGDILVIDDLAAIEPISYFGNTVNIIESLIYAVYEKAKDKKNFEFYATTDVTSEKLSNLIGTRAMSRLTELALWSEGFMKGSDRRIKQATNSKK